MSGGTTGTPKGVVGLHRGMVVAGLQLRAWLRPAMREWTDKIMLPLPLFHTYRNTGVQGLALINHNPIALIPNPREIRDLLKEIIDVKPAFICTVPTLLQGIMNHPMARQGKVDFSSIKLCFSGAAPLMAETKKRCEELTGGVIVEGYSLTEAQMAVIANPVRGANKIGSVGMPLPDVHVRIVDSEDGTTPVQHGEVGEIVIRAQQLMEGYWQKPEETNEMIRTNTAGERLLYTGDLGYLDEDGYVFIVDRKKDLNKTSGFQVWPREIEEVIASHPAVAEVGVAGVADATKGEAVRAWVVLRAGQQVSEAELRTFCRERLAPYKVPSTVVFRTDLPKMMVWVLKGADGRVALVDSGFHREQYFRQFAVKDYVPPPEALAPLCIGANDVTDILLTHMHWDHAGGIDLFPSARVWIQKDEYDYYTGEAWSSRTTHGGIDADDVLEIVKRNTQGKVAFVKGDDDTSLPGIRFGI